MYFSVIRNRGQKRKISIGRIGIALLAILMVFGIVKNGNRMIKVAFVKNIVRNNMEIVLYNVCKFVVAQEYSVKTYENLEENQLKMTDIINYNSNLHLYIEEQNEIQVMLNDPSYVYSNNSCAISKDTTLETSVDDKSDTDNKNDKDNTNNETVVNNEPASNNVVGLKGYVPPKVTENGIRYTMEQLSNFEFLMNKLYIVPSRAKVIEEELNAAEMLAKDMSLTIDNSKPQILIYHTHSQEGFADSVKGKEETYILGVGDYLTQILSEVYGYNVIHCREKFDMKSGKLDRSKAYTYAEEAITQILEDNPTIEVVIDLHRDGLKEGAAKLVTNVDGKEVAKIMFFNGVSRSSTSGDIDYLYNRYKKDNLAFSFQLKLAAMECFPEYTRKNYIDAYQYNQHLRGKSVLIEVGAQNNTLQEELNSMEVLAEILHRVIK